MHKKIAGLAVLFALVTVAGIHAQKQEVERPSAPAPSTPAPPTVPTPPATTQPAATPPAKLQIDLNQKVKVNGTDSTVGQLLAAAGETKKMADLLFKTVITGAVILAANLLLLLWLAFGRSGETPGTGVNSILACVIVGMSLLGLAKPVSAQGTASPAPKAPPAGCQIRSISPDYRVSGGDPFPVTITGTRCLANAASLQFPAGITAADVKGSGNRVTAILMVPAGARPSPKAFNVVLKDGAVVESDKVTFVVLSSEMDTVVDLVMRKVGNAPAAIRSLRTRVEKDVADLRSRPAVSPDQVTSSVQQAVSPLQQQVTQAQTAIVNVDRRANQTKENVRTLAGNTAALARNQQNLANNQVELAAVQAGLSPQETARITRTAAQASDAERISQALAAAVAELAK